MAMKKNTGMMRLLFVLALLIFMVISTQFNVVQCRALRSMTDAVVSGCEENLRGSDQSSVGVVSFSDSSNNAGIGSSLKSLAFRLASGPSKRGPGH
ncbi:hypothetical protein ACOSP7_010601 [Xanthoceras sorbifolium]|uniref:Uncharacterized protein n=1 Tax=Xanthoceras sorbifolium TaxID=99658 RepID=A0ABQ8HSY2_9ROSI|nr:hypothetical protein JRO89_XS07G0079500 [Xanthoceras sorbifolium]